MSLIISFNDDTNYIIYAFMFNSKGDKAYSIETGSFDVFSLENQSNFVIFLEESLQRPGFYNFEITDDIPATEDGEFYVIEIFEMLGSSSDRSSDTFKGSSSFCWDGTKEVALSDKNSDGSLIENVWNYENRSLTQEIDKEVWEYSSRSITQDIPSCPEIPPCPDNSEDIKKIEEEIKDLQILMETKLEELTKLIESQKNINSLPKTQNPKINNKTASNPSIKFN